jgi:PKD repeat protein
MQNPVHRYANQGTYTVSLTATNSAGSTSKTQAGYVTVTSTGSITVIVPHGGESWTTGSTYGITWTSSGNVGSSVNIELLKGDAIVQTILASTENDGSYSSWTISTGLASGSDYRVRVTSVSDPAISGISNGFFSITSPAPSASITVTAPNGGESWVAGTKHWISWTSSGSAGSYVTIELLKGDIVIQTIVSSTKNNGGYKWTVPKGLVTGTDYRVRVTSVTNPAVTDTGNGDFTIR